MPGQGACKAIFFSQDGILEFYHITEFVLTKQHPRGIDFAAIFILVSPAANRVKILQGKPQWIEFRMATSTILTLAVHSEAFSQR